MTKLRQIGLFVTAVLLSSSAAARDVSHNEVLELRRQGLLLPLEQVLEQIETHHPAAQVLEVELDREGQHYIYEIEILTRDRQVRELEIDARSGTILEDELEN
ncbi:MAG: PepSY domain-containing protein [Porticoccaceae bacterium]|nr:PepSY domain-containing protein [Porticoccaceae bacterium]